jgi:NTE family protein
MPRTTPVRRIGSRSPYPGLDPLLDIFHVRQYFEVLTGVRDVAERAKADATFLDVVRHAMLKLPFEARRPAETRPFPPLRRRPAPKPPAQIGIVATGGSGALAALAGIFRACEELRVRPRSLSFASGAALFAFPFAAGKTADEIAEFTLGLDPADWIDPDWGGLAGFLPKRGRGFAGIVKGDRIEAAYERFLGRTTLGQLDIPAYAPLWSIEQNRLEYVGPKTHPRLRVSRAIRMAISIPLFLDPQRWRGGYWGDGGIVDIFPVRPLLELGPSCDSVLAVNCFYPPNFKGEDGSGWKERTWSVLDVAEQVRTAQQIELARANLRRLQAEVPKVQMIDPVPYEKVRGAGFYQQFLDNREWPDFMRSGRAAALKALPKIFAKSHPKAA